MTTPQAQALADIEAFAANHVRECARELLECQETSVLPEGRVRQLQQMCKALDGRSSLMLAESIVKRAAFQALATQAEAPAAEQPTTPEAIGAKRLRPGTTEEPWVVWDDAGVRVTFTREDAARCWRAEFSQRLENARVTYEPPRAQAAEAPAAPAQAPHWFSYGLHCARQVDAANQRCAELQSKLDAALAATPAQPAPVVQPLTAEQLWNSEAVMEANAAAGLTMDVLLELARAVQSIGTRSAE